ncbi:complex I intermediate-associated protein 30-domain-containing protein [Protomyces lactucae-debilis]|uniref:Complex I intermediate-associated protein 30-domain-containing protein n=1 Tax=Protomyces lactucae-debilis TaxID=2754530 RepID=A0A1Y2FNW3_PROLT|nr:complex I intermediate-associated protein 30-domain-containing protein [Protomyces lactucae-debilis]ORY85668.1 complex I intermediate-associated protein 30-domain-containing protein [Protomyces lactucae-debilis]
MNFLKRSAQRLQRQAVDVLRADPTPSTARPMPLFEFPADADRMITGSDADYQTSTSVASIRASKEEERHRSMASAAAATNNPSDPDSYLTFEGKTAQDGYAALRSKVSGSSFYGTETWDIGPYANLSLLVRGDSRKYFVNLQTDSYLATDLYQHRLFLRTPGEWEHVVLPFDDFTLTNNGQIQDHQVAMDKYRLKTIGVSILDRMPGKFKLDIKWIRAANLAGQAAQPDQNDANNL